jgi:hypothetical protein
MERATSAVIVNYEKGEVKVTPSLPGRLPRGWQVLDGNLTKTGAKELARAMHPTLKLVGKK